MVWTFGSQSNTWPTKWDDFQAFNPRKPKACYCIMFEPWMGHTTMWGVNPKIIAFKIETFTKRAWLFHISGFWGTMFLAISNHLGQLLPISRAFHLQPPIWPCLGCKFRNPSLVTCVATMRCNIWNHILKHYKLKK